MGSLDTLCEILMEQIEFVACDDNFNNDDGTLNQEEFDRSIQKCDSLVGLSKQVVEIARIQLQAVDTAFKWNVPQENIPKSFGCVSPRIE